MTTIDTSKRDALNARVVEMFHEWYPDAAEQLFARSQELWGPLRTDAATADPKAAKFAEIIGRLPICDTGKKVTAELVSELAGTTISLGEPESRWCKSRWYKPGMMVVPLRNPNHHDYKIGRPALCLTEGQALREDAETGNTLPLNTPENIRPATLEETREFVQKVAAEWWWGLATVLAGDYDLD